MALSLLRIDWYSFVVGAQIPSIIGIFTNYTTSSQLGLRFRFSREYLYPTVDRNGNAVFLFRMKEPANWVNWMQNGARLFCKVVERNIFSGVVYACIFKRIIGYDEENIARAFICGGIMGLFTCLSSTHFRNIDFWQTFICFLLTAELSTLLEEVKIITFLDNPLIDFDWTIPFKVQTFLVGAFVGGLAEITVMITNAENDMEELELDVPVIEDSDSIWVVCLKTLRGFGVIYSHIVKLVVGVIERFLVGGVMQCAFEYLLYHAAGQKFSLLTGITSACLYGVHLGLEKGQVKRVVLLALMGTSEFHMIEWLYLRFLKTPDLKLPPGFPRSSI